MGETKGYEPNDDDKNIDKARATEPVSEAGEKSEIFSYWLAGKLAGIRPSLRDGTVIIEFDAKEGSPQIFGGGGEGETMKRFFIEVSEEGYRGLKESGSGVVRNIVRKEGDVWVTQAAIKARSGR